MDTSLSDIIDVCIIISYYLMMRGFISQSICKKSLQTSVIKNLEFSTRVGTIVDR